MSTLIIEIDIELYFDNVLSEIEALENLESLKEKTEDMKKNAT